MKTKARNGVIHSFQILFNVSKFNSVFKLISQVSCHDLPANKKKQPQPDYKQPQPDYKQPQTDYKGKRSEIRE